MKQKPGAAQNLELHIDELVLHGFSPRERYAIGEAVQRELTQLFAEHGIHPSLRQGHIARLDGGSIQVKQGTKADAIGKQVAQTVYGGMKR
jgi:hypothetical protein